MPATDDVPGLAPEPAGPPLRLLVVDADRRVRSSLTGLLELAEHVDVVGSVGHARAALDACESRLPDAVVIDPRLPELLDGVAFIRRLRAERPEVRIVVIAWAPGFAALLGDDRAIRVIAPDGGDLGDRILDALRPAAPRGTDSPPGADARLDATA
jgi:CheY-like chemotaxis protein